VGEGHGSWASSASCRWNRRVAIRVCWEASRKGVASGGSGFARESSQQSRRLARAGDPARGALRSQAFSPKPITGISSTKTEALPALSRRSGTNAWRPTASPCCWDPEGGWTDGRTLPGPRTRCWRAISLGPQILRAENRRHRGSRRLYECLASLQWSECSNFRISLIILAFGLVQWHISGCCCCVRRRARYSGRTLLSGPRPPFSCSTRS